MLTSRIPMIRARHISVTGTMHEADKIPNQDRAFTMLRPEARANKNSDKNLRFRSRTVSGVFAAGVFDGHGPHGQTASSLAAERMEHALDRLLLNDKDKSLIQIVSEAFQEVAVALNSASCSADSGSTGSLVLLRDDDVVVANVGDSSVLFVSKSPWMGRKCLRYETRKHRPSDEEEKIRILASGGYIQGGYVVDEGAKNGIAVSRTLGDRDMQQYGCISDPEIRHFKIRRRDTALLLASDGLWDVPGLNVKTVLKTLGRKPGKDPQQICDRLLNLARVRGGPTDDCTIACMTLG